MRYLALISTLFLGYTITSPAAEPDTHENVSAVILAELIELETTAARPDLTLKALKALQSRLLHAGIPGEDLQIHNPNQDVYAMLARYRGTGDKKPLLLMAHIDVVPADPAAWTFPPFTFVKGDGYYFGRGSQDNKTGVTQLVSNFIRLRREGFVPNRDLIMAVTGDEESNANAIEWLAEPGRNLIDAEFALNTDVGGGIYGDDMQPLSFKVSTSEKLYQTYRLSVSNRGGHSSLPRKDNAINQLVAALTKIADYRFPAEISDTTKIMLRKTALLESGQLAQDLVAAGSASPDPEAVERLSAQPEYNAAFRTTCIATQLQGGHAENALPNEASAVVNCRIMPGHTSAEVAAKLVQLVADPGVTIESMYAAIPSPPSELSPELLQTLEGLVHSIWPETPVIPVMSSGASDGLYLRNAGIPVYGITGWFMHPDQDRSHGMNEKIGIAEFNEGIEFWYRLLKRLSE